MRFRALLLSLFLFACHERTQLAQVPCSGSCGSNIGSCREGYLSCDDDGGATCIGSVGPSAEVCDGQDNDCDGLVDNSVVDDLGSCSAECTPGGVEVCQSGQIRCIPIQNPVPETCNDRDDDCDGIVDNVVWDGGIYCYTGPADTAGVGRCHPGVWKCRDRRQVCTGVAIPAPETVFDCNGVDDDCDGVIDNGVTCTSGASSRDLDIQLSWSTLPNDIDLHLRSDRAVGSPFNWTGWGAAALPFDCFYANMTPIWGPDAGNPYLSVDDLIGPGPEHIRIDEMPKDGGFDIGVHLFSWKSGYRNVQADATVNIFCGGALVATRTHLLKDREFWYVGKIRYTPADPCLFEDAPDGGPVF